MELEEAERIVEAERIRKNREEARKFREYNESMVGKFFKFRNSYGTGDSWWLYIQPVKAGNKVMLNSYENTSAQTEARQTAAPTYSRFGSDYIEISKSEFEKGKKAVMDRLK